jgi:chromosomal replication initiation ATPase DnaA
MDTLTIKQTVADYFRVPESYLDRNTRERDIVIVRQIAHYFAANYNNCSLTSIGELIGSRDHATVINSRKTINNLLDTHYKLNDYPLQCIIDEIKRKLEIKDSVPYPVEKFTIYEH